MKRSIFFASLIASCMWFDQVLAQTIVTRRRVICRPARAVIVKPARLVVPTRGVIVFKTAPVVIPAQAVMVSVASIRPYRPVVVYR